LNGTGYQTTLVKELEKYNIAIAGLTEARLAQWTVLLSCTPADRTELTE